MKGRVHEKIAASEAEKAKEREERWKAIKTEIKWKHLDEPEDVDPDDWLKDLGSSDAPAEAPAAEEPAAEEAPVAEAQPEAEPEPVEEVKEVKKKKKKKVVKEPTPEPEPVSYPPLNKWYCCNYLFVSNHNVIMLIKTNFDIYSRHF